MSYDIYLYKSTLGRPDLDEAAQVVEDDSDIWAKKPYNYDVKIAIERGLLEIDSTLEGFNYDQLAKQQDKTVDQVKREFMKFELNSTEGEPEIQLEIYDYHVAITVPYSHQGEQAIKAFDKLKKYVDTIRAIAGYFVYDPQSGEVFDPTTKDLDGLAKYLSVSNDFDRIISQRKNNLSNKPWWKFW